MSEKKESTVFDGCFGDPDQKPPDPLLKIEFKSIELPRVPLDWPPLELENNSLKDTGALVEAFKEEMLQACRVPAELLYSDERKPRSSE